FYGTYEQENEAEPLPAPKSVVLGSGPIRIGQGIEFDYCSVRAAGALRHAGQAAIMINSNPETVSTDFDASTRLYFEPLDEESVLDVLESERDPQSGALPPTVFQFGGQTAMNLSDRLTRGGVPTLGSGPETIEAAENRRVFEDLLDHIGIPQPPCA